MPVLNAYKQGLKKYGKSQNVGRMISQISIICLKVIFHR